MQLKIVKYKNSKYYFQKLIFVLRMLYLRIYSTASTCLTLHGLFLLRIYCDHIVHITVLKNEYP